MDLVPGKEILQVRQRTSTMGLERCNQWETLLRLKGEIKEVIRSQIMQTLEVMEDS